MRKCWPAKKVQIDEIEAVLMLSIDMVDRFIGLKRSWPDVEAMTYSDLLPGLGITLNSHDILARNALIFDDRNLGAKQAWHQNRLP
jgi:hypothetical protein